MKRMLLTLALVGALTAGTSCAGGGNTENTESSTDGKEKTEKVDKEIPDGKPHLEFMGIPIDGSLKSFASRLEKRGLELRGTEDGVAYLEGEFAGRKGCQFAVISAGVEKEVSRVVLLFPRQRNWAELEGDYSGLKKMLAAKYGEPKECVEKFESETYYPSAPVTDEDKWHSLFMGRCKYYAVFENKDGVIILDILGDRKSVRLDYADKVNLDKLRDQAMDDL